MRRWLNKNHFAALLTLWAGSAFAASEPLEQWLMALRHTARAEGISEQTFDRAFVDFEPLEEVLELDRAQPETTKTFEEYLDTVVSDQRIGEGRRQYRKHKKLLQQIGQKYGVPPTIIVALWGVETNYGENTGDTSAIDALATLAYDSRRRDLFQSELLYALKIADSGEVPLQRMEGSWAGAMGQSQFMPSSFVRYAVDYNGDGKRDIWDTLPDVFASIANYLSQNGWNADETWGMEAALPNGLSQKYYDSNASRTLEGWRNLGVSPLNTPLSQPDSKLEMVLPERISLIGYLVTPNYKVLLKWNHSRYFATSVGLLADAIEREE